MKKPMNPLLKASLAGLLGAVGWLVYFLVSDPESLSTGVAILVAIAGGFGGFLWMNYISIWHWKKWEDKERIREEGIDITELTPPDFDK